MLKALYDYAVRHELVLPEGCVNKTVKAYISLDKEGHFIGIYLGDETNEIPCPDIGSLANGKDKSNVLIEKRSVVIPETESAKSRFFLEALKSGSDYEPMLGVCAETLENKEISGKIREELDNKKIKDSARISFRVDGKSILESDKVMDWWIDFRKQFNDNKEKSVCLITGEHTAPMKTTTPINGLSVVGGHARGDALICFDKKAFCSYNLEKAFNAPVSEKAFAGVKAALDELLKEENSPVEAGAKFVHWYDKDISREDDIIRQAVLPDDFDEDDEDDELEEFIGTDNEPESSFQPQKEIGASQIANSLIESVKTGETPKAIDCQYYILILSGVGGRIMIRRYERGSYKQLRKNIMQWYDDLSLINSSGIANIKNCKLTGRLMRLLKYQKVDPKPFERMNKELSGITPAIIMAIINASVLPDSIAAKALANIRSKMLETSDDEKSGRPVPDVRACQWLKVWLIRKNRQNNKEEMLMDKYNMQHKEAAYHCGGLMAVYARIQEKAMEGVNSGVIQRYYASASRTPALVLSQLNRLSNYHLDKLEHSGYLKKYLEELYSALGDEIPVTLTLEQQSYFALGYYQMIAKMNEDGRIAKNELNKKNKVNTQQQDAQKEQA